MDNEIQINEVTKSVVEQDSSAIGSWLAASEKQQEQEIKHTAGSHQQQAEIGKLKKPRNPFKSAFWSSSKKTVNIASSGGAVKGQAHKPDKETIKDGTESSVSVKKRQSFFESVSAKLHPKRNPPERMNKENESQSIPGRKKSESHVTHKLPESSGGGQYSRSHSLSGDSVFDRLYTGTTKATELKIHDPTAHRPQTPKSARRPSASTPKGPRSRSNSQDFLDDDDGFQRNRLERRSMRENRSKPWLNNSTARAPKTGTVSEASTPRSKSTPGTSRSNSREDLSEKPKTRKNQAKPRATTPAAKRPTTPVTQAKRPTTPTSQPKRPITPTSQPKRPTTPTSQPKRLNTPVARPERKKSTSEKTSSSKVSGDPRYDSQTKLKARAQNISCTEAMNGSPELQKNAPKNTRPEQPVPSAFTKPSPSSKSPGRGRTESSISRTPPKAAGKVRVEPVASTGPEAAGKVRVEQLASTGPEPVAAQYLVTDLDSPPITDIQDNSFIQENGFTQDSMYVEPEPGEQSQGYTGYTEGQGYVDQGYMENQYYMEGQGDVGGERYLAGDEVGAAGPVDYSATIESIRRRQQDAASHMDDMVEQRLAELRARYQIQQQDEPPSFLDQIDRNIEKSRATRGRLHRPLELPIQPPLTDGTVSPASPTLSSASESNYEAKTSIDLGQSQGTRATRFIRAKRSRYGETSLVSQPVSQPVYQPRSSVLTRPAAHSEPEGPRPSSTAQTLKGRMQQRMEYLQYLRGRYRPHAATETSILSEGADTGTSFLSEATGTGSSLLSEGAAMGNSVLSGEMNAEPGLASSYSERLHHGNGDLGLQTEQPAAERLSSVQQHTETDTGHTRASRYMRAKRTRDEQVDSGRQPEVSRYRDEQVDSGQQPVASRYRDEQVDLGQQPEASRYRPKFMDLPVFDVAESLAHDHAQSPDHQSPSEPATAIHASHDHEPAPGDYAVTSSLDYKTSTTNHSSPPDHTAVPSVAATTNHSSPLPDDLSATPAVTSSSELMVNSERARTGTSLSRQDSSSSDVGHRINQKLLQRNQDNHTNNNNAKPTTPPASPSKPVVIVTKQSSESGASDSKGKPAQSGKSSEASERGASDSKGKPAESGKSSEASRSGHTIFDSRKQVKAKPAQKSPRSPKTKPSGKDSARPSDNQGQSENSEGAIESLDELREKRGNIKKLINRFTAK